MNDRTDTSTAESESDTAIDTAIDTDASAEIGAGPEADSIEVVDEVAGEEDAADSPAAEPVDQVVVHRTMIDPRGPRFGAAITVVVLAVVLLTIPSILSVLLLVVQAVAFGAAALFGLKAQPYGWLYRTSVAPRLGPPADLEDEAPPRFAQQVGLAFVLVALVALSFDLVPVALVATAFALAAAFLNAAFNFCLGCEIYLLFQRVKARRTN